MNEIEVRQCDVVDHGAFTTEICAVNSEGLITAWSVDGPGRTTAPPASDTHLEPT